MSGKINKIPILLSEAINEEFSGTLEFQVASDPLGGLDPESIHWGPNGRWLIQSILAHLQLERRDEVAIITTSDQTYVSTCLSVSVFNFCKVSRLVTPATSIVIVVHEFGYVLENIAGKIKQWREQGKVVVEDCAHLFGVRTAEGTVGQWGDYAVYSLPKIIPAEAGGMLLAHKDISFPEMTVEQEEMAQKGKDAAGKYLGYFSFFNEERLVRSALIKETLRGQRFFDPSSIAVPFFQGIVTSQKREIIKAIGEVEWGATLRQDLLYFPTNPVVVLSRYENALRRVSALLGQS
ncbi:DegT/DnrJ/EryC1/StrS family aminotransferase [Malonomonas rubra]|nr:DegT/DnrJ/EryC1/StrS family aminotransferase [Malonomonas rubra]